MLAELPFLPPTERGGENEVRIDLAPPGARPLPLLVDTGSPESFATPSAAWELGISLRRSKQTPYRRATRLDRDVEISVDTRRGETTCERGRGVGRARRALPRVVRAWRSTSPAAACASSTRSVSRCPSARRRRTRRCCRSDSSATGRSSRSRSALRAFPRRSRRALPVRCCWQVAGRRERRSRPIPKSPRRWRRRPVRVGSRRSPPRVSRSVPSPRAKCRCSSRNTARRALARAARRWLGVDLLKRFVMRIDYPRKRLWIAEPAP